MNQSNLPTKKYTNKKEYGYCFLCLRDSGLREVIETFHSRNVYVGWECSFCGGISIKPHKVCPAHGKNCRMHLPLE